MPLETQSERLDRTETVGSAWSFIGASKSSVTGMAVKDLTIFTAISNGGTTGVIGADRQGFGTWYANSKGLPSGAVTALDASPDGSLWATAAAGGVYRSGNGGLQ